MEFRWSAAKLQLALAKTISCGREAVELFANRRDVNLLLSFTPGLNGNHIVDSPARESGR